MGFVLTRFHAWNTRPMTVWIGAFIIIYLERDVSCSEVRSADTECGGGVRCAGVTCRIRGGDLRHVTPRALQRDVLLGFQHHHSLPARIKDVHMRSPRLQGYSSFLAWHDMRWCDVLGHKSTAFIQISNYWELASQSSLRVYKVAMLTQTYWITKQSKLVRTHDKLKCAWKYMGVDRQRKTLYNTPQRPPWGQLCPLPHLTLG